MKRPDDDRIGREQFANDGLRVTHDTDIDEVKGFLRRRTEKAINYRGTIVWNYSSHSPDYDALEYAIEQKLENRRYVIPFQVGSTWATMYYLLPESLKQAEVLVYKPSSGQYRAYKNFYDEITPESSEEFTYQLSKIAEEVDRR